MAWPILQGRYCRWEWGLEWYDALMYFKLHSAQQQSCTVQGLGILSERFMCAPNTPLVRLRVQLAIAKRCGGRRGKGWSLNINNLQSADACLPVTCFKNQDRCQQLYRVCQMMTEHHRHAPPAIKGSPSCQLELPAACDTHAAVLSQTVAAHTAVPTIKIDLVVCCSAQSINEFMCAVNRRSSNTIVCNTRKAKAPVLKSQPPCLQAWTCLNAGLPAAGPCTACSSISCRAWPACRPSLQ